MITKELLISSLVQRLKFSDGKSLLEYSATATDDLNIVLSVRDLLSEPNEYHTFNIEITKVV